MTSGESSGYLSLNRNYSKEGRDRGITERTSSTRQSLSSLLRLLLTSPPSNDFTNLQTKRFALINGPLCRIHPHAPYSQVVGRLQRDAVWGGCGQFFEFLCQTAFAEIRHFVVSWRWEGGGLRGYVKVGIGLRGWRAVLAAQSWTAMDSAWSVGTDQPNFWSSKTWERVLSFC